VALGNSILKELPVHSQGRKVAGHGPVPIVGEVGEDLDQRRIGGTLRSAQIGV